MSGAMQYKHTALQNASNPPRAHRCARPACSTRCASASALATTAYEPSCRASTGRTVSCAAPVRITRARWARRRSRLSCSIWPTTGTSPRPEIGRRRARSRSCTGRFWPPNCGGHSRSAGCMRETDSGSAVAGGSQPSSAVGFCRSSPSTAAEPRHRPKGDGALRLHVKERDFAR